MYARPSDGALIQWGLSQLQHDYQTLLNTALVYILGYLACHGLLDTYLQAAPYHIASICIYETRDMEFTIILQALVRYSALHL